tara:strand:+ start:2097 stop:2504 length:408 start_codon:yes stop_codon:yes gene_type:complete
MSSDERKLENLLKGMERRIKEKDLNVRNLRNKLDQEKKKKKGSSGWGAYYNCKKKLERFLGRDIELPLPEVDNTRNLQREERNRLRDAEIERVRNERNERPRLTQAEINDRVFREYELYGADRAEQLERELEGGF